MPSFKIESDGTPSGTKLYVDGKDITGTEAVTNLSFSANGALYYNTEMYGKPRVDCSYTTMVKTESDIKKTQYSYSTNENRWVEEAIGKDEKVTSQDSLGKPNELITNILKYSDNSKNLPSIETLSFRSNDSLIDLLKDLEIEHGKK